MNKQDIVNKVMVKLGMMGQPNDPLSEERKQKLLREFWNEKNPDNVDATIRETIEKEKLSKESVQDLLKFFKLKGLFKRTLEYPGIEKVWRYLLKDQKLQGFLLLN